MIVQTQLAVETPESIDLQATPAGVGPRAFAYMLDFLIRTLVNSLLAVILVFAGKAGTGIFSICAFLLEWFYPVFFEVLWQGQTPGKKVMGIAVVNDDLTPISWGTSIVRNLLRFADLLPAFFLFGTMSIIMTKHCQRLGDLVAGTLVVYRYKDTTQRSMPKLHPQPPPIALDRDDQIAVIGFTQRHNQISEDRQQELADILAPILPVDEAKRIHYLRGVGGWLLGAR